MTTKIHIEKGQNDEISFKELTNKLKEWWHYLLSKWFLILAFVLLGGILGFTYAYFQKPIYTATTTFVLESNEGGGSSLGQYAGLASMVGVDFNGGSGGIFQGDNIIELYKSRKMIEKTLLTTVDSGSKDLLMDSYIRLNKLKETWAKKPELLAIHFGKIGNGILNSKSQRLRDSLLGNAVEDINLNYLSVTKPDKKLSIIKVDVRAKDEVFAKVFNEELVKNVNDFYLQTKTKKSLYNIKILESKTDSVRRLMNRAIYNAVEIADATPDLNPTRQTQRIAPVQKAQFSVETNKAILGSLVQNLELTKMALLKETPLIQALDVPIYPLHKNRISKPLTGILFGFLLGVVCIFFLVFKKVLS